MEGKCRNIIFIFFCIIAILCNAALISRRQKVNNSRNEVKKTSSSADIRADIKSRERSNLERKPIVVRKGAHFWYSPQGFLGTQTSGESGEQVVNHFETIINDTVETAQLFMNDLQLKAMEVSMIMDNKDIPAPKNIGQAVGSFKNFVSEKYLEAIDYIRNANTSCYRIACSIATCYLTQADWCILKNQTVPENIQAINATLIEDSQKQMKSAILRIRLPLE